MKIAILDDYQNVALRLADWAALAKRAEIIVFNDHVSANAGRCLMRSLNSSRN
jgi:hypothetical protein